MPTDERTALVVSSTYSKPDPRIERHMDYLRRAGWTVGFVGQRPGSRLGRFRTTWNVITTIRRRRPNVVILPNPELHVLGSIAARLFGVRPVIDIQEDYRKVAMAREWIPRVLRPIVGIGAGWWEGAGRRLAAQVVVAAPELRKHDDHLVMNMPDPDAVGEGHQHQPGRVVYVGDVTIARGALEMVRVLAALGPGHELLVIGGSDNRTRDQMESLARELGVIDRLAMPGRVDHVEAWDMASRATAGLCLLRPVPAYMEAVATKIFEYTAHGVPPVVSDLPGQSRFVADIHPDLACASAADAARVIQRLDNDVAFRKEIVEKGRRIARDRWARHRPDLALQRAVAP